MRAVKKPPDPRGAHTRLYWELQDSMAWRALSPTDRDIWLCLRRKLKGTNNGNIEATLSSLKHCGVRSSSTLAKSLRVLQALGFIEKTRQGGIAAGGKECSLYRFTDEPVFEHPALHIPQQPATNEWKQFENLAQARAVLREAHMAAKRHQPSSENKHKLRDSKQISSKFEPESTFLDSKSEHDGNRSVRNSKRHDERPDAAKPRQGAEFRRPPTH